VTAAYRLLGDTRMLRRINDLSLSTRIIALTIVVLLTVVGVNYAIFVDGYRESADQAMVEKAAAFTAVADAAKNHQSKLMSSGTVDMTSMLADLKEVLDKGGDYHDAKLFEAIPVVVGWMTAEEAAKKEGIEFRIAAFEARNRENEPESGSFRAGLLRDLEAQVKAGGEGWISRVDTQTNSLHYMRAIELDQSCMMCHGNPGNEFDTDKDGKDPIGFAMEGWSAGDTHGAYEVVLPMSVVDDSVASFILTGAEWSAPLVVVSALLFAWLLRGMFGKPMRAMISRLRDISQGEGDLTQRLNADHKDEIGQASHWFNAFLTKLEGVMGDVLSATTQIDAGASQISGASQQLASGASEQAGNLQEISASLEETSSMTKQNADNASRASALSDESSSIASSGQGEMNEMNKAVAEIKQSSDEVRKVIKVIDDIAFQTNLLALNAAVEAARAGEAGKGFAVVAEEVRNLAQRSAEAARETGAMIEASTQRADRAVEITSRVGTALSKIVESTGKVNMLLQEIAAASKEQAQGIDQINTGVAELDKVTQGNAGNSEELAAAAEETASQVSSLRDLVGTFKISARA